ncbi:hypothetical protein ACFYYR_09685 [Streptomyces sp. NPDC001922]|uniref:hypothetical protein n=1 Tax=Streptomyces sp. NPDC001922 TaxID=3364624 RepID=UPI0036C9E4A6
MTAASGPPAPTPADRSAETQFRTEKEPIAVTVLPVTLGTGTPDADCIADSAGGLTFDIAAPAGPPAPDGWDAALVLRRRGGDGAADEVRLPLVHANASRLRAVLPSTVPLPEGRWDASVALGGGEPERLAPGILDLRSLVDRRPDPDRPSVAVRVPYATKHGNLSVRSWHRTPHAEAGEILLSDGALTVQVRLYGVTAGRDATAEARCRRDPSLVRTADACAESAVRGGDGDRHLAFTLPFKELSEAWEGGADRWDLWLRPTAGAEPVRIARILDDVPDKKHIFTYPAQPVTAPHGPAEVGPYYTADNNLSVRIGPVDGSAAA